MPILDGRPVPACDIDPARHRFIGMWRPPEPPKDPLARLSVTRNWLDGLYDEPQYVTTLVRLNTETGEVEREPLYVQEAGGPQGFGAKFGDTVKIRRPVEQIREKERAPRPGNQFVPMSEVFPNEPESVEPVEQCGNCRFFIDHKEAPGECCAHPEPVEKFSFHWCGEWEPR